MAVIPEPKNAYSPIVCSLAPAPKNTEVIAVLEKKAVAPIDITLLGMLKEVKDVSRKALSLIVSNRDDSANSIESSAPLDKNALAPIDFTLDEIRAEVIPEPPNAFSPIEITP